MIEVTSPTPISINWLSRNALEFHGNLDWTGRTGPGFWHLSRMGRTDVWSLKFSRMGRNRSGFCMTFNPDRTERSWRQTRRSVRTCRIWLLIGYLAPVNWKWQRVSKASWLNFQNLLSLRKKHRHCVKSYVFTILNLKSTPFEFQN